MIFGVLKHFNPMIGSDLHNLMPPGSPSVTGVAPHYAFSSLMGIGVTAQMCTTEYSHFGWTLQRGTDIGPMIPHAGVPNCLLPLILVASGSKSEFGSSQYLVKNKPAAIALGMIINPNLNCGDPLPRPSDVVLALTGHFVGMTLGDLLLGLANLLFDMAMMWALGKLGDRFQKVSLRIYEKFLFGPMCSMFERMGSGKIASWLLQKDFEEMIAKGLAAKLGQIIIADFVGSPVGYSFPINAYGWLDSKGKTNDADGFTERGYNAAHKFLDSPHVDTHNVSPPPSATAPDASESSAGSDGGAPISVDPGSAESPPMSVDPASEGSSTAPADASDAGASSATPEGADPGPNVCSPGDDTGGAGGATEK